MRWRAIGVGSEHSCALAAHGAAFCWGANRTWQLGDSTQVDRSIPVPVATGARFASLSVGYRIACGLTDGGALTCWGTWDTDEHNVYTPVHPVLMPAGLPLRSVEAGGYVCVLDTGDAAYCFYGWRRPPEAAAGGWRFRSLSAGGEGTCGLTVGGTVQCWDPGSNLPPVAESTAQRFRSFSARGWRGCGVSEEGAAWCRGQRVAGTLRFHSVETGPDFACGLTADSLAYCWGANRYGQLGNGTTRASAGPVPVTGGHRFRSIATGQGEHACGLSAQGVAWCWGANALGQLGDGTTTDRPSPVRVLDPDSARTAEESRSVLVLPSGRDADRPLPAVVLLPYTWGSAKDLWRSYEGLWGPPIDDPGPRAAGGSFAVLLVPAVGFPLDYASVEAWNATIARYERRILDDVATYASRRLVDPERVVLAGFSLGGDLSWALSLRNPTRFRGAVVMGSRASYRAGAAALDSLSRREARYVFALGEREDGERLAGARAAQALLERRGIASRYMAIRGAGHEAAPVGAFGEALDFVLRRP